MPICFPRHPSLGLSLTAILSLASPLAAVDAVTIYPGPPGLALAPGSDGKLWITCGGAYASYSTSGSTHLWDAGAAALGEITAGPDGALWATDVGQNQIARITTAGELHEYALPTAGAFPQGLTAGPDGALWFCEEAANRIGRITTAGAITEYALPDGAKPLSIASAGGALWFTAAGSDQIGRISTAGSVAMHPLTVGVDVRLICAGPDGALWFTEGVGRIGRMTTAGALTEFAIPHHTDTKPLPIAVGSDGALWIGETHPSGLVRCTTGGAITEYDPFPLSLPIRIVTGPDHRLWITDGGGRDLIAVDLALLGDPTGSTTTSGATTAGTAGGSTTTAGGSTTDNGDGTAGSPISGGHGGGGSCGLGGAGAALAGLWLIRRRRGAADR